MRGFRYSFPFVSLLCLSEGSWNNNTPTSGLFVEDEEMTRTLVVICYRTKEMIILCAD